MELKNQIHIYSLDTKSFYTGNERYIDQNISEIRKEKAKAEETIEALNKILSIKDVSKALKKLLSINIGIYNLEEVGNKIEELLEIKKECNKRIKAGKELLYEEFEYTRLLGTIRTLDDRTIRDNRIISLFKSSLTNALGVETNEKSEDLIIVQAFYFEIIEDIINNGFYYKNKKYVYFSSSAGQIRTKKCVFIREDKYSKIRDTLTCGLSVERINEKGGMNINKYLAYLALSNSATEEWKSFDIDKSIVVDDFETLVEGEVDFIDDKTYEIERKRMQVPIPHMDGCGIMLPKANNKKSTMVRLPWVKGLLVPFPFDKFIKENNCSSKVVDVYGKEYDIFEDDIKYIFTKSQFKMKKYYDSWEEYKENFKKFNCVAGKCNEEENDFAKAKINYQMLQTLCDITEEEMRTVAKDTIELINNIGSDREAMMEILGVTKENNNKNYLQKSIEAYPNLLQDGTCKEALKETKASFVKSAKGGRLLVNGTYTFLIPDLYAFCEWLFLGIEKPNGLLKNKEVYCSLYENDDELAVLRSPHLYREWAIRKNIIEEKNKKWFVTKGIYTSSHDMISKILQFDNDGDKSLVIKDQTLVEVAKRNMKGIVPLFYNMSKAGEVNLTPQNIYNGLKSAFTGGNIGIYSNNISKIWNSPEVNIDVIKLLCMENNFCIDYAKTLYKPERPKEKDEIIKSYTKLKLPHFFKYAKDKESKHVQELNKSCVNKLENIIPDKALRFDYKNLGKFNYMFLLSKPNFSLGQDYEKIIEEYDKISQSINFTINKEDLNGSYPYKLAKEKLLNLGYEKEYLVNTLIKYLYSKRKESKKKLLWECFGEEIYNNIVSNTTKTGVLGRDYIMCKSCGKTVEKTNKHDGSTIYCDECKKEIAKEKARLRKKKQREREKVSRKVS